MIHLDLGAWAAALGRATWQGGLLILLAWGISRLIPRIPADLRCWVWRLVYLKLVFSFCWTAPLLLPLLPGETAAVSAPARLLQSVRAPDPATPPYAERGSGTDGRSAAPAQPSEALRLLFAGWLLGVGWCGLYLAAQWRRISRLRGSCQAVEETELLGLRAELCRRLGIVREPPLLASDHVERPMLVGLWRPAVLLPLRFSQQYGPSDHRLVLAHELSHLKRHDLQWEWLRVAARTLFFFHPFVWCADAEWRFAQELACDESTLRVTAASPGEYGRLLLRTATSRQTTPLPAAPSLGIGESYGGLRRRLGALAALKPLSPAARAAAAAGILVLAATSIVPWRAVASSPVTYVHLREVANHSLDANFSSSDNPGNDLSALPRGEQVFAGFRFQIDEQYVQLAGLMLPDRPLKSGGIHVGRRFSTLAVLHGTAWGGAAPGKGLHVPDGTHIGTYTVRYLDGNSEVIPIVYGEDVRDWWVPDREETPVLRGRLAWSGQNPASQRFGELGIRLYVTVWKNPRPRQKVSHIEFASTGTAAAPFCVALTCGE